MILHVLIFLTGILTLHIFTSLPSLYWCLVLIPIMMIFFSKFKRFALLILCYGLGFSWSLLVAHHQAAWTLAENLEGKTVSIRGYIANIPNAGQHGTSFLFAMKEINKQASHALVRLIWDLPSQALHAGDEWELPVHLKKTYGNRNPGTYDYEAYAFQEGIRANGYVMTKLISKKISSHWYYYLINRFREKVKNKIAENLLATPTSPWITALTIGERHNISAADWQVLRYTGTNHLMAIAGLHIGLMALLAHVIVSRIWRRIPYFMLKLPASHAGAFVSLLMALFYSCMAGFSIPAQRACIMLAVFLTLLLARRQGAAWQSFSVALFCVLILNPLIVVTESFWLSFGAVGFIIYGVGGRLKPQGLWWKYGRIQWVITLGLIPMSLWLFQQCAGISFAANMIAIPWIAYGVVPLCFLGCFFLIFSSTTGSAILSFADKLLSELWHVLTWFSHLPNVVWYQSIPHTWMLVAAMLGIILLLLPIGFPGRYFAVIFLLPVVLYQADVPQKNSAWFTLLDVGQGLASVVQTQHHTLVFDTGAHLSPSFDMGESVVVPFLHQAGIKKLDMLVISHGDNDHIGGADAVVNAFPTRFIKTSDPEKINNSQYCMRGETWQWDGVNFEFLYPTKENLTLNNNSSCVLRVTAGNKKILLTGDIEKFAEKNLVKEVTEDLPADILVAPHHGSKTSAVEEFIDAVNPRYVLFSMGYRNRYHFPHPSVIEKYRQRNVIELDTAKSGAIQFVLNEKSILSPALYRSAHKNFWNN